jgi:hypothetical protein
MSDELDEVHLARLARQHARESIAALVLAIRTADDLRITVTAALGLLDRAYGRPAQGQLPQVEYYMNTQDLDRMIARLERELKTKRGDGSG